VSFSPTSSQISFFDLSHLTSAGYADLTPL
jgi:hypothetical protein